MVMKKLSRTMRKTLNHGDPLANELLWLDPCPTVNGMLASDWIEMLAVKASMIEPFCRDNLRPASYELTLGPEYQLDGENGTLDDTKNPKLTIPPNSIAFVSMAERLMLPHYVVGRFDLSIKLIYQGLLLGTGPQVDPGFHGRLSCPLHNISDKEIHINLGEPFAKIDFQKTTGFASGSRASLESTIHERSLYESYQSLKGYDNYRTVLFDQSKRNRVPIIGYQKNIPTVSSSVRYLEEDMKTRFRNLWRAGIASIVGLILAVVGSFSTGLYQMIDGLQEARDESRSAVQILETATSQQEQILLTQAAIEGRLEATQTALENRIATLEATPSSDS
jgi:deoxycytidine triphosphate deaminase